MGKRTRRKTTKRKVYGGTKKTKARNYTLETINKNIYIFGIAMDEEEKKEVINEANKIYDVEKVIPSIYLVSELSRNKL